MQKNFFFHFIMKVLVTMCFLEHLITDLSTALGKI